MEKIISLATMQVYEIEANKSGENYSPCPECYQDRSHKNQKKKCFSYNTEIEAGYCNHCNARFVKHNPFEKKDYQKPNIEFQNFTKLSDGLVKWFSGRGISQKTLLTMQIGEKSEWMPQIEKDANCVLFPFYRNSELINVKYRDARKNFKLSSGAELIWYNYDAILNHKEIIICEGEIDALSFIQAGFDNVISVPNGANIGRMDYFDSSFEDLNKVESFVIATDNDLKGVELKNDLIRRLGMEKCKTISFNEYKDANELLSKQGTELLKKIVNEAKFIMLPDIYQVKDVENELLDFFLNGMPQGKKLGIPELDELIRWETGRLAIGTGIPGMGKGEFLSFVYAKLNSLYGWPICYYSPESMPIKSHFANVYAKFAGKELRQGVSTMADFENGKKYLNDNVYWVNPAYDIGIDEILAKFEYLVKAKGCKLFVIDPWNKVEQEAEHSNNERLFIKKNLVKMSNFARRTDSLLTLVAHPTKMPKDENGKYLIPGPYNISGSADFLNMADYTFTVHRNQNDDGKFLTHGSVVIQKTKINKTLGDTGTWAYLYNINNGRYISDKMSGDVKDWDNSNWITKEEFKPVIEKPLPTIDPDQAFEDMFDY